MLLVPNKNKFYVCGVHSPTNALLLIKKCFKIYIIININITQIFMCIYIYFKVNFSVFFKLIKVHFLVSELYIYQIAQCNNKKKYYVIDVSFHIVLLIVNFMNKFHGDTYSLTKITETLCLGINSSHFYEERQTNKSAAMWQQTLAVCTKKTNRLMNYVETYLSLVSKSC
jgi:hypothetical protein